MWGFEISRAGYISKGCVVPQMTDQGYWYISIPTGSHGRTARIWINRKAVIQTREGDKVTYQINDWLTYRRTEKGNIVLMPSDSKNETIVYLKAECGYRGSSSIEIENGERIFSGAYYHSPRGSLGVSDCGLFLVRDGTKFKIKRTGRLYGAPSVIVLKVVFSPNNVIELIKTDEEADEELKSLL